QEALLELHHHGVAAQGPGGLGVGIVGELGVEALDDRVVGGDEILDGGGGLGGVGGDGDVYRSGAGALQVERDARQDAGGGVRGAGKRNAIQREVGVDAGDGLAEGE